MRHISRATFHDEVVRLDNTHFTDCTLTDCTLAYDGGNTTFERTSFHGCRMLLDDAANRTVQLLQCLGYLPCTLDLCEIAPTLH